MSEVIEYKIYEPILEVKSIISMLVENIYNNQSYQSYLSNLEESPEESDIKKAKVIKKTFMDIRVFNTNSNPLFLARDIGVLTGASNINNMLKNYNDDEKVIGYIEHKGVLKKKYFLTRHGIYRTLMNSRTKLSEVFRGFIYKILDHMQNYESEKLKALMQQYANENPELIKHSLLELHDNVNKYMYLYEKEKKERLLWETKAEEEHYRCNEIEQEKIEMEIECNYREMQAQQLENEKKIALSKLITIKEEQYMDQAYVIDELDIMKKKFLKEITIFILKPDYAEKLLFRKKPTDETPNHEEEKEFLEEYKTRFNLHMDFIKTSIDLIDDCIMYYYISFKSINTYELENIKDKYVYLTTDYVYNKDKFNDLLEILKNESDHFRISPSDKIINNFIYKTNYEHIKSVLHDLLIQSINTP